MASESRINRRGEKFDDSGCENAWRWEWLSIAVNREELRLNIRKVSLSGQGMCLACDKHASYASRGLTT